MPIRSLYIYYWLNFYTDSPVAVLYYEFIELVAKYQKNALQIWALSSFHFNIFFSTHLIKSWYINSHIDPVYHVHIFLSISTVCNTPMKPVNGDVYSDGLTAIYSCRTGFTMEGVEKRYCGTDGSGWNETEPTCSKYSFTRVCQ